MALFIPLLTRAGAAAVGGVRAGLLARVGKFTFMPGDFSIAVRTLGLNEIRKQFGIELRSFEREQRRNMARAVTVMRDEVQRQFDAAGIGRRERHTTPRSTAQSPGHTRAGVGRRIRKVGPGEYIGTVKPTKRGYALRFIDQGTVGRYTEAGAYRGQMLARGIFERAAVVREREVVAILGDSFKVIT